ncbi:MAG TPA: primosomal protein N' [Solimonas sp.]|nr:primosomal protein N' [Solimonas sp.]
MSSALEIVSVGVPVPLQRLFDYRVPPSLATRLEPGMRVRVPFGRRQLVGVVAEPPRQAMAEAADYRPIEAALDTEPLLPAELLALCRWCSEYYHHPLGEVLAAALPGPLRRGRAPPAVQERWLQITPAGINALAGLPARAGAQRKVLDALRRAPLLVDTLEASAAVRRRLLDQGWVELTTLPAAARAFLPGPPLTAAQSAALAHLRDAGEGFGVTLLEGVTGSGKTELYLQRVAEVVARGGQALVLAPEIGLTPQLVQRFSERFGAGVASFHSGMTELERARTWMQARAGEAMVVIGTRSAVFVPFARLGLIVLDEEHDVSFKQQEGFRYSARDSAIVRAQRASVPVILGTATPCLETLRNVRAGRYRHVQLRERVHGRAPPRTQVLDLRGQALVHGLSAPLLGAIERHLGEGGQALLFINRRGYAPVLLCHDCGWMAPCAACDAHMTLHRARRLLVCHHCGAQQAMPRACPSCFARALLPVGLGTERIEDALRNRFPRHRVERFDSDRLSRKGELERMLDEIRSGKIHVVVGTQMLAKGHDFSGVSLVGIVSADQALYGNDFRAIERMGQLLTQVAGRAGRAGQAGEVLLQTHEPGHPLLRRLLEGGYGALCDALLEERRGAGLPPFAHLALLRAESEHAAAPLAFLQDVRAALAATPGGVAVSDPVPALMEKRAGQHRAQLLLQSRSRAALQAALAGLMPRLEPLRGARRVRWSLDVDPADLF